MPVRALTRYQNETSAREKGLSLSEYLKLNNNQVIEPTPQALQEPTPVNDH
jgi:hypothetical protein